MTGVPRLDRAYLTQDGRHLLAARIRHLETTVEQLRGALDDPERAVETVENYQRAAQELQRLRWLLASAGALDEIPDDPRVVVMGDRVTIRFDDGGVETYILVHPAEAPFEDQRISVDSPLGSALLARHVGETIEVALPSGSYRCEILRAARPASPAEG